MEANYEERNIERIERMRIKTENNFEATLREIRFHKSMSKSDKFDKFDKLDKS